MKVRTWMLLSLFVFWLASSARGEQTAVFDQTKLTVDMSALRIDYDGFAPKPTGQGWITPSMTFLVRLSDNESILSLHAMPGDVSPLGITDERIVQADLATSDERSYPNLASLTKMRNLSECSPITLLGQLNRNGERFAEFLLSPVSFDSEGTIVFCGTVSIFLGDRPIAPEELLPREDIQQATSLRSTLHSNLDDPTVVDYRIVTSAALAEAFAPLVRYKNETGYRTDLVLIENILAASTGRDDAEKLRSYLADFHESAGRFVLLGGDETVLPVRYAYSFNSEEPPSLQYLQLCDLYFADLTGEWDVDNDGVWGEPYDDQPDLTPELLVGRLPFNQPEEVQRYIEKLITYETSPGKGNPDYLIRTFFFSTDQMRDYGDIGQHGLIAEAYPAWFTIDTVTGVEATWGGDPAPTSLDAGQLAAPMSGGYGIINVIAHGRNDGFAVKSAEYNLWPKTYMLTQAQSGAHGCFDSLSIPDKPAFYYSLACDNAAFDGEQPPFSYPNPNMAQQLLAQDGGAVGFIGYSRWGWVSSSHLLQKTFFDSLFAHPERPAVEAMYASKAVYHYVRDIVYGQNYLGDPTLRVYTDRPSKPSADTHYDENGLFVSVTADGMSIDSCQVVVSESGGIIAGGLTGSNGSTTITARLDAGIGYTISLVKSGMIAHQFTFVPSIAAGIDETDDGLPTDFTLAQNFPNPFNPTTTIAFELPQAEVVRLDVYNVLGQLVTILVDGSLTAGPHTVEWDGTSLYGRTVASGVYFYRLRAGTFSAVKKMSLLK